MRYHLLNIFAKATLLSNKTLDTNNSTIKYNNSSFVIISFKRIFLAFQKVFPARTEQTDLYFDQLMLSSSFSSLKMFHVFGSHRRLLPSIKSRISCFLRQKSAFSRAPKRVLSDDGRDYDQAVLGLPPEPSKIIGTQPKFPARNSAKSSRKRTATDYKFM